MKRWELAEERGSLGWGLERLAPNHEGLHEEKRSMRGHRSTPHSARARASVGKDAVESRGWMDHGGHGERVPTIARISFFKYKNNHAGKALLTRTSQAKTTEFEL